MLLTRIVIAATRHRPKTMTARNAMRKATLATGGI